MQGESVLALFTESIGALTALPASSWESLFSGNTFWEDVQML